MDIPNTIIKIILLPRGVIQTYNIEYRKNKRCSTHTTLNLESFWDFMGHKNYELIEIGYHIQSYISEY